MNANDQTTHVNRPNQPLNRTLRAGLSSIVGTFALVAVGAMAETPAAPPQAPTPPAAAVQPPAASGVETLFKRVDSDGDGFISKSEMEKADPKLSADFDKYDLNKDGKLSLAEFDAMMKALRT